MRTCLFPDIDAVGIWNRIEEVELYSGPPYKEIKKGEAVQETGAEDWGIFKGGWGGGRRPQDSYLTNKSTFQLLVTTFFNKYYV